jgi:Holliday junction resolvase RusA-like endonuclease
MAMIIDVIGIPAPGGSKRAMRSASTGRVIVLEDCKRTPAWRQAVAAAALVERRGRRWPLRGALSVLVVFRMPRPKGHYLRSGDLSPRAPGAHIVRPDATKLWRSTEDALTGIVWADDALICYQGVHKRYVEPGELPGARIRIYEATEEGRP